MYTLYTDGSAVPNPGPCGAGAVLIDMNDKIIWTLSEFLGEGTNNVGELTAILRGVEQFSELHLDGEQLTIYSDSELSVHLVSETKQTTKPHLLKILQRILKLKTELQFSIQWVKAHSTNVWNNYADVLANNAVVYSMSSHIEKKQNTAPPAFKQHDAAKETLPVLKQPAQQNTTRILLSCSFKEKDKVKALGARWDPENKSWWVEDKPENQETFAKWISANQ